VALGTQVVIVPCAEARVASGAEASTARLTVRTHVLRVKNVRLHRAPRLITVRCRRSEIGRHTVNLIPRNSRSSS
jgi:hypothetical protein